MTDKRLLLPFLFIPAAAAMYLILKLRTDDVLTICRALALIGFGFTAAYIDLRMRKVPNRLVLALLVIWLALTAVHIIIAIEPALSVLVQSLIAGAAAGGFFLFIYMVSRKGIGGGDVKLFAVIGLYMTFTKVMQILFFCSLLTVLVSAVLLITKRATMKSAIPLVPFLYIGMLIVLYM